MSCTGRHKVRGRGLVVTCDAKIQLASAANAVHISGFRRVDGRRRTSSATHHGPPCARLCNRKQHGRQKSRLQLIAYRYMHKYCEFLLSFK